MSAISQESAQVESADTLAKLRRQRLLGLVCGLTSAFGYTLTNMALRYSARPEDFGWDLWITTHKAIPATVITWLLVAWNYSHGKQALPGKKALVPLMIAGLIMQFGGNLTFQIALGLVGLAMTVPITFAALLVTGAIYGRISLGESIHPRTVLALATLMVAVSLLSQGAGEATKVLLAKASYAQVLYGVVMALISGASYGICGVVIRRNVRNLPVSAALVLISTMGVVAIGGLCLLVAPWEKLLATTPLELLVMQLGGLVNAGAFFCLGFALRYLNVNQVNMINTTQITMATLAGLFFFSEPLTTWLIAGVLLTIVGLFLMDRR